MSKPANQHLVAKSNSLIQACYKLSLHEQHLILQAVSRLNSRKPGFLPTREQVSGLRIYAEEFAEMWGISKRNAYKELKDATNDLYERTIVEIEGKRVTKMRWVSSVSYHEGEGWAQLSFSPEVVPYLTSLHGKFTEYRIGQVAELRSTYSIRLFEWCIQFVDTGWLEVSVDDIQKRLGVDYAKFTDLRRYVIDPAVAELSAKADLEITYKTIKKGVKIVAMRFEFKESDQRKLDLEP